MNPSNREQLLTDQHFQQLYQLMVSHFDEYKGLLEHQWEDVISKSHESISLFISAFNNAAIGMALVSLDGKWLKTNSALSEIIGYSQEELQSFDFQSITHQDDLQSDLSLLDELLAGKRANYHMEKRYIHRDGHQIWVLLSVSLVKNQDGSPRYFISQIQDINQRKLMECQLIKKQALLEKTQDELIKLAMYDPVTGLANRQMFTARFKSMMATLSRSGGAFSLLLISIDNFRVYSNAYGHRAGEHALQLCAGMMSAELSHWDLLARYGDAQFIVLLNNSDQHMCSSLCDRLRHSVDEADFLESRITLSIGCTTCTLQANQLLLPTQDEIVQQLEDALQHAQRQGGNCTMSHDVLIKTANGS